MRKRSRKRNKIEQEGTEPLKAKNSGQKHPLFIEITVHLFLIACGLVILVIGADLLVEASISLQCKNCRRNSDRVRGRGVHKLGNLWETEMFVAGIPPYAKSYGRLVRICFL